MNGAQSMIPRVDIRLLRKDRFRRSSTSRSRLQPTGYPCPTRPRRLVHAILEHQDDRPHDDATVLPAEWLNAAPPPSGDGTARRAARRPAPPFHVSWHFDCGVELIRIIILRSMSWWWK
jgi:hypothetical protein